MDGRHELKHFVNPGDCALLRSRLRAIAKPDANADADGGYMVRSLYFDNYSDKAVVEKLSGLGTREKFRLRYYNGDVSFIRLEKKSKANRMAYKQSAPVTAEMCEAMLKGKYDCLKTRSEAEDCDPRGTPDACANADAGSGAGADAMTAEEADLLMELYAKMRYQNLRPKSIVDYRREAYVYRAGNVRVTFDSGIRMSNGVAGFLDPKLPMIPAAGSTILEVKYDGFLPDVIRDILQIGWRSQTEFSKYAAARMV